MKNFIFKSSADFHKIVFNKLETIQNELRHQRSDMGEILRYFHKYLTDVKLQKQVDEYFEDDDIPNLPLEDNAKDIPEEKNGNSTS